MHLNSEPCKISSYRTVTNVIICQRLIKSVTLPLRCLRFKQFTSKPHKTHWQSESIPVHIIFVILALRGLDDIVSLIGYLTNLALFAVWSQPQSNDHNNDGRQFTRMQIRAFLSTYRMRIKL